MRSTSPAATLTPSLSAAQEENRKKLLAAAKEGRADEVRSLLNNGVDINCRRRGQFGLEGTPLWWAAGHGRTECVRLLIDAGADVDFVMPRGKHGTALSVPGDEPPLSAGGFYPARNTEVGNGASALHAAVENGHLGVTQLLLARGSSQERRRDSNPPAPRVAALMCSRDVSGSCG